jgi:DNA-binding XRE family transcriptional regulator
MSITVLEVKRREKKLSQDDFAKLIGGKRSNYGHIERRHIAATLRVAKSIAKALDSSIDVLFDDDGKARIAEISVPAGV